MSNKTKSQVHVCVKSAVFQYSKTVDPIFHEFKRVLQFPLFLDRCRCHRNMAELVDQALSSSVKGKELIRIPYM